MQDYYKKAARLLEAGDVLLVTQEMGRHAKPSIWREHPVLLTVRQTTYTINHNVMVWTDNNDKYILDPHYEVKVLA
jgi:hypothetical protein